MLHVVSYLGQHAGVGLLLRPGLGGRDELVVLRRHHDGVDAAGAVVFVILHRHLALGVGAQVGHLLALAAYLGQHIHDVVGQRNGQRHVGVGFVVSVAEHHALVAGALCHGVASASIHAAVDVGALLVNGAEHAAAFGLKLVGGLGVANAGNGAACGALQVDIGFRLYLAGQHHLACGDECFARHLRLRVVGQKLIENGI